MAAHSTTGSKSIGGPVHAEERTAAVCYNCQQFNHSSRNCHLPARCVRCGGDHNVTNCTLPKDSRYADVLAAPRLRPDQPIPQQTSAAAPVAPAHTNTTIAPAPAPRKQRAAKAAATEPEAAAPPASAASASNHRYSAEKAEGPLKPP
ncbi:sterile alpha motif domain-containing protein 1-like [Homalodisca vitripennis]|uniref:sterile alpha motif domain-containing protein 1-like n=1 Tax=Homalodisca vitripennis TaxID=197043 RepID=UPI001EEBB9C9|nr:sterile alpha motif domain-containing protein 1-like [Homalodisca vitripennis]